MSMRIVVVSIPVPKALMSAEEIALNSQLAQALKRPELDAESVRGILKEAAASKTPLDTTTLEYAMRQRLENEARKFAEKPRDPGLAAQLRKSVDLISMLPFPLILWQVQNICYPALVTTFDENGLGTGIDSTRQQYLDNLAHLAEHLHIRAPQLGLQP